MAIDPKKLPILVIIHQLLNNKYNQINTFSNMQLELNEKHLERQLIAIKEKNEKTPSEANTAAISQLTNEMILISDKISQNNNKYNEEFNKLTNKFQHLSTFANNDGTDVEYKNELAIDNYLQQHPNYFKDDTRTALLNFYRAEDVFGEIQNSQQLEKFIALTDKTLTDILEFCSEKHEVGFKEDQLNELNTLIKTVKSEELQSGLLETMDREVKTLSELIVSEGTNEIIRCYDSIVTMLTLAENAERAPYIRDHSELTETVNELHNNDDILLEDRFKLIKLLLKKYRATHNINSIEDKNIDEYIDTLEGEAFPIILKNFLVNQKLTFDSQQENAQIAEQNERYKNENSILSFYRKINGALQDETRITKINSSFQNNEQTDKDDSLNQAKKEQTDINIDLSDEVKKAKLIKICRDLLSVCIKTKEDFKLLGRLQPPPLMLNPLDNKAVKAYCDEETKRILKKTETPAKFAEALRKINFNRKNSEQPYTYELYLDDPREFIRPYAGALIYLAATVGISYVYVNHKESVKQIGENVLKKTYQSAQYGATKGVELMKKHTEQAIISTIGMPVVSYLSKAVQRGITNFFQSPNKESTEENPEPTSSASIDDLKTQSNGSNDGEPDDERAGDKLQKTPKK